MILTFAEDFSNTVSLDAELIGTPESGRFFNKGVHPDVNVNNILAFLPYETYTFGTFSASTLYGKYADTLKRSDIVSYNSKIYISQKENNKGNTPGENPTSFFWLETNIESLRLRSFIEDCKKNMISALSLDNRFIENQYIYNISSKSLILPNNYAGWKFSPKNSDYVKIRINQICLQASSTEQVSLYAVNQGRLLTTFQLFPENGELVWDDYDYELEGIGDVYFVIDSMTVLSSSPYNDPLRYTGFVATPVSGTGASPESADYVETSYGNGLNFNISVSTDTTTYINNNLRHFSRLFQLQFEYDAMQLFVYNPYNQKSGTQANLNMSDYQRTLRVNELKNMDDMTIARKYHNELRSVRKSIEKTIDTFLVNNENSNYGFDIEIGTI